MQMNGRTLKGIPPFPPKGSGAADGSPLLRVLLALGAGIRYTSRVLRLPGRRAQR